MKRNVYIFLFIFLIFFAFTLLLTLDYWPNIIPKCFVLKTTGFYCPGCGGTRALICLLEGRFITSFKYNPAVIILSIIITFALIEKIFNKKILPKGLAFWVVLIALLFIYYILRNFIPTLSLNAL